MSTFREKYLLDAFEAGERAQRQGLPISDRVQYLYSAERRQEWVRGYLKSERERQRDSAN